MKRSTLHRIGWIAMDLMVVIVFLSFIIIKNMLGVETNEDISFLIYVMGFGILIVLAVSVNEIAKSDKTLKNERIQRLTNRIKFHEKEIECLNNLVEKENKI